MSRKNNDVWTAVSVAGSVGLNMVATVAVGLFIGRWIDEYLTTSPWFSAGGVFVGMLAGLWSTYKKLV